MMLNFLHNLKQRKIALSLTSFNLMVAVWLGLVLNFSFLKKIQTLTPYEGFKAYAFIGATAILLIALYNFILQILDWKWTAKFFAIILVFIGGFSAYFVNSLGVVISPDQIQNMMQTDSAEATDLLSLRFAVWIFFFVVFFFFFISCILFCFLRSTGKHLVLFHRHIYYFDILFHIGIGLLVLLLQERLVLRYYIFLL